MTSQTVFDSLQGLFPQLDARALRAAAIEHSKDVDAAVVAVLDEILPFFTGRSTPNSPLSHSDYGVDSLEGSSSVTIEAFTEVKNDCSVVSGNELPSSCTGDSPINPLGDADAYEVNDYTVKNTFMVGTHDIIVAESSIKASCGTIPQPMMQTMQDVQIGVEQKLDCIQEKEDVADGTATGVSIGASGSEQAEAPELHGSTLDKSHISLSTDAASNGKNMTSTFETEDESTSNSAMSSQFHIVDVMEEAIADARNNKITLFSKMENVINLMKQVEVKEKAAEQAKTKAAMGVENLLNQVEEFQRMLCHAKEANDMHAGEVYGEKSILATELRELQSRLHSLSDERDKSLADLDEVHQSLEVRLAVAENEIQSAELEKLVMEESARRDFVEQEIIMEKVVQESKILKQQAGDNAKLQEYLVDLGHVVDTLQGEIAVICQDVKLLKEKVDQRVPLGKLLLSSHTSFILASSVSSLNSLAPDQVETSTVRDDDHLITDNSLAPDQVETLMVRDADQLSSDCNRDDENVPEATAKRDCKVLIGDDDEWEFFDRSEATA